MKPRQYILTIVLTLLTAVIYGQNNSEPSAVNVENLTQTWHLFYGTNPDDKQKTYRSKIDTPHGAGEVIVIRENGDFVSAYSAQCGNDQNNHYDKGKWTLDKETMILTTTFVVLFKKVYAEYQIVSLSDTELVLKEIETPAANNR